MKEKSEQFYIDKIHSQLECISTMSKEYSLLSKLIPKFDKYQK